MSIKFLNNVSVDNSVLYVDGINNRVGIGLTSPAVTLHVDGFARLNGGLQLNQDGAAQIYQIQNNALRFGTNNIERMRILADGNVGIGTTSPSAKLDITQTENSQGIIIRSSVVQPEISFVDDSTGDSFSIGHNRSANRMDIEINGTDTHTFTQAGKVGIGTINPQETLQVDGNILVDSVLLSNQENTDVDSAAAEMVAQVAIATYTAVFFDFVIKKETNVRSGTVYACHDGTNVEFTETSTQDLGDTSDVTLSVDISSNNIRLVATVTSDDWSIKTLVRAI